MPTVTKPSNAHTVVSTGWTNPGNAQASTGDNVYATALNGTTTKNVTHSGDFGFANIGSGDIPDGATIDQVRIRCEANLSATGTGVLFGVIGRISGADAGTETTKTTTTEEEVVVVVPGVTLSDLRNASTVLKARCRGSKGNTSSAFTINLDYVRLEVDYTVSGTAAQEAFRVRKDDTALNTDAGWSAAQNTNVDLEAEQTIRLRFRVKASGGSVASAYQLRYSRNGGAYTALPVQATPVAGGIIPAVVSSTPSAQFTDDASITSALLTGGSGTFVNGRADAASNVTSSISLASGEYTELEFAVRIPKYYWTGSAIAENTDGTTFDFRVYKSDGTALDSYTVTPRVTVDSAGLVGGCWAETPHKIGPIVDGNGNMYFFMEAWEDKTSGGFVLALKSSDGGQTWAAQGINAGPGVGGSIRDAESMSVVKDNQQTGRVYVFITDGSRVQMSTFRMSDHATNPDTWTSVGATVNIFGTSVVQSAQWVSAAQRSDGDLLVFWNEGNGTHNDVRYSISTDGGANWSADVALDATGSESHYQAWPEIGASDLCYVFYIVNTGPTANNGQVYYKTISSTDSVSGRTQVSATALDGGSSYRQGIAGTAYYDDDGVEHVVVAWVNSGAGTKAVLTRALRNGTLQTAKTASDVGVAPSDLSGNQGAGSVSLTTDATAKVLHLLYGDVTTYDLFYDFETDDGGWGTDTEVKDAVDLHWVRSNVLIRGGSKYLAYIYDNGTGTAGGGQGPVYYGETELTIPPGTLNGVLFDKVKSFLVGTVTGGGGAVAPSILGTPTTGSRSTSGTSLSFSHTLSAGANRRQLILVQFDGTGTTPFEVSTVTYGGVSATRVTDGTTAARHQTISGNSTATEIWEVREANLPSNGSNTVVITMSANTDNCLAVAVTVQDTDQATNVSKVATLTTSGSTNASTTIVPSLDNSLLIDNLGVSTDWSSPTPGTNQTTIAAHSINGVAAQGTSQKTLAVAGSTTMSWTWSTSQARRAMLAVAFAPAAGAGGATLSGVLFDKAPSFITGTVSAGAVTLAGAVFTKAPVFIAGTLTASFQLSGVTFTAGPVFISGEVRSGYVIVGNLFARPPTWITGAVTSTYELTGVVFAAAPVFVPGALTLTTNVVGALFSKPPSFTSGTVTAGTAALSGNLFSKPPAFSSGSIQAGGVVLDGVSFVRAPTFQIGTIGATFDLGGQTFEAPPTFIPGTVVIAQAVSGNLFTKPPAFISGVVQTTSEISGVILSKPPAFTPGTVSATVQISGVVFEAPPSFGQGLLSAGGSFLLGVVFSAPPNFITGEVTVGAVTLTGVVFTRSPSFIAGDINAPPPGADPENLMVSVTGNDATLTWDPSF